MGCNCGKKNKANKLRNQANRVNSQKAQSSATKNYLEEMKRQKKG